MTNRLWFFLKKFEAMYDEISTQSSFVLASPINTRGWWLHISDPEGEDNRKVDHSTSVKSEVPTTAELNYYKGWHCRNYSTSLQWAQWQSRNFIVVVNVFFFFLFFFFTMFAISFTSYSILVSLFSKQTLIISFCFIFFSSHTYLL